MCHLTQEVVERKFIIKDSYLLLPLNLRELCNSFSITNKKTYFPFKISDINYRSTVN